MAGPKVKKDIKRGDKLTGWRNDITETSFFNWFDTHILSEGVNTTELSYVKIYMTKNQKVAMPRTENVYLYFVVCGTLRLYISGKSADYNAGQYLISMTDMPDVGYIISEDAGKPFVALSIEFNYEDAFDIVTKLTDDLINQILKENLKRSVMENADEKVADEIFRLINIAYNRIESQYLGENIRNEILFYVFCGKMGSKFFRSMISVQTGREIYAANVWIRKNYKIDFSVEKLAGKYNMSVSTFHKKFKDMMGVPPLQFQKQLRLTEARRLMMEEGRNVSQASEEVGYKNFSQFIREYRKKFGVSPGCDIKRIRKFS